MSWLKKWWIIPALIAIPLHLFSAWVGEDAFITLRTVEQLHNGNGLVWNTGERVQVFTSPLWFGILAIARFFIHNAWWMNMIVSLLAGFACMIQAKRAAEPHPDREWRLTLATILVVCTAGIFDYFTSGLENPLYFLLLGGILLKARPLFDHQLPTEKDFLTASALTGLLAITRHDQVLIVAPLMGLWWLNAAREKIRELRGFFTEGYKITTLLASAALASLPLLLWTAFSTVWFGVPLPNTAYAKLAHGVSQDELWVTGTNYAISSIIEEPALWTLMALGTLALLRRKTAWKWALLSGIAGYLFYVTKIGGDYMLGRFYGGPAWVCLIAWLIWKTPASPRIWNCWNGHPIWRTAVGGTLAAAAILAFHPERVLPRHWDKPLHAGTASFNALVGHHMGDILLLPHSKKPIRVWGFSKGRPNKENPDNFHFDITNERCYFRRTSTLWKWWFPEKGPYENTPYRCVPFNGGAAAAKKQIRGGKVYTLTIAGGIPFILGPRYYCIDPLGITNAFYSRQPAQGPWRAGHLKRDPVPGFEESIITGTNLIRSPRERQMFDDLTWLTQEPDLWHPQRWQVIRRYFFDPYGGLGPGEK